MLNTLGMDEQNDKETARYLDEQWTNTHTQRERVAALSISFASFAPVTMHGTAWPAAAVV